MIVPSRVERLSQQKQQIISDLEKIKDEVEDLKEKTNGIEYNLDALLEKQKHLTRRVEQVVYRVESKSPFMSEAENCMRTELEGVLRHISVMSQRLAEVGLLTLSLFKPDGCCSV